MPKSRIIVKNKLKPIMTAYRRNIRQEFADIANEARDMVAKNIRAGNQGLNTETGAAAASVYSVTEGWGFSDISKKGYGYLEASNQFNAIYSAKYGQEEARRLTLGPFIIKSGPNWMRTATSTTSLYLGFWEVGHMNRETGIFEHRPQFAPVALYMQNRMAQRFKGMLYKGVK